MDVERGRVAISLEQYGEARDLALAALRETPDLPAAHQLYVDATASAGLGSRGLQELMLMDVAASPWFPTERALVQAVEDADYQAARSLAEQLLVTWPEHPEALLPLWDSDERKIEKLRDRITRALIDDKAIARADLATLYRIRRLLVEIEATEGRSAVETALVELGEPPPPPRRPLDRIARSETARVLATGGIPALPWGYPSELVDITERASAILFKSGRQRHAALTYQQLQRQSDDPVAWIGEAEAWLAAGDPDKADRAAQDAVVLATHPREVDLPVLNVDLQRSALARALRARARVREVLSLSQLAVVDLALSHVFSEEFVDDKLAERLHKVNRPLVDLVQQPYGYRDSAAVAVRSARASTDRGEAMGHLDNAMFLVAATSRGGMRAAEDPDFYGALFAPILMARAEVEAEHGRVDQARAAAVMATLLAGRTQPWWWSFRGSMHEKNGEIDAAFAAYAVARGLGVPDLDARLEATFVGLGAWGPSATAVGGPPPAEPAPPPVPDASVAVTSRPSTTRDRRRPATAPRLGEPFPATSMQTPYGTLSTSALRGRAIILTFWNADCEECLQLLPTFGTLARDLRREGRDTVLIGVSLDSNAADFEGVSRVGEHWGQLVHAPALGPRFGIDRLPTTWVVDRSGVARYYVDHWFDVDELEVYLRDLD